MKKKRIITKYPWLEIKREYITNPQLTQIALSKKYKVPEGTLNKRATREKWGAWRVEITKAAEQKMIKEAEYSIKEMKSRHLKLSKLLQKLGIEAIEKGKYIPKSAKEARQFISEGVRMEREATGVNRKDFDKPAIVNIISQERDIIGKYFEEPIKGEEVIDGEESIRKEGPKGARS